MPNRLLVLLAAAVFVPWVAAQDRPKRKLELEVGERFYFEERTTLDQDLGVSEFPMTPRYEVVTHYTAKVTSKKKGGFTLQFVVARIHGSMDIPMFGKKVFDSRKKTRRAREPMLANVGKSFELVLDGTGRVRAVRGFDRIWEKSFGADVQGNAPRGPVADDAFTAYWLRLFPGLPSGKRTRWPLKESGVLAGLILPAKGTIEVVKQGKDEVRFAKKGSLVLPARKAGDKREPAIKLSKCQYAGSVRVSTRDGLPLEATARVTAKYRIDARSDGDPDVALALDIRRETTLKRVVR